MFAYLNSLSIRSKIFWFVVPSTISFGILLTVLALYFLNDFKEQNVANFVQVMSSQQQGGQSGNQDQLIQEINRKADVAIKTTATTFITIVVVVIMLAAVGALLVATMIGKPLSKVAEGLKNISSGDADLTQRLPVSSTDETGMVSKYFNDFLQKLQGIIKSLQGDTVKLQASSEEIYQLIGTIRNKTDGAKELTQTVIRSAGYQSRDMEKIAQVLEDSTATFHTISAAVEQLTATVGEIAGTSAKAHANTTETTAKMEKTLENVSGLGQAADQIGKVTETISEISDQVNLLALNATIEAARAGDAGKGFAVVANEIKELARQVANAATEIKARIEDVQQATQTTIVEIRDSAGIISQNSDIVATIASAVEEQSATVNEIAHNLSQASERLGDSNNKISQAAVYATEMAKMSSTVNEAVIGVEGAVTSIQKTAEGLKTIAEQSAKTTRQFRT